MFWKLPDLHCGVLQEADRRDQTEVCEESTAWSSTPFFSALFSIGTAQLVDVECPDMVIYKSHGQGILQPQSNRFLHDDTTALIKNREQGSFSFYMKFKNAWCRTVHWNRTDIYNVAENSCKPWAIVLKS